MILKRTLGIEVLAASKKTFTRYENTQRQIKAVIIRLIIGAIIFFLLSLISKSPETGLIDKGKCSGYIGYAIYIIGEAIWKTYSKPK